MDSWMGSLLSGSASAVPARFIVGDTVEVLRAARLPKVEDVVATGVVERVTGDYPNQLYWIGGLSCARSARELRLILRGER